jgi:hypothetical protein
LAGGGVGSIRAADCGARSESALGEVDPISNGTADPVIRHPPEPSQINSTLSHEIFDEPTDLIVGERGDDDSTLGETVA